jgi:hypothetical protein
MGRTIKWALILGALLTLGMTDFVSTLATCQKPQYGKPEQSSEKGCGLADSLTGRTVATITEWIDARHDFVTAAATVVVAFFTFTLWRATNRLWDAGERQLSLIKKNAEDQSKTTAESIRIAGQQTAILGSQADVQMKQHAVGRLQFLATHRPKLRVRHVSVADPALHIGHPTLFYSTGEQVRGGLVVVNVGGSNATIIETRYRIFFSKTGLPITAPYDEDFRTNLLLPNYVMGSGESCATPITDTIIMDASHPDGTIEIRPFEKGGWTIYVMGQIRYRDVPGQNVSWAFVACGTKPANIDRSMTPTTNTKIDATTAEAAPWRRAPTR